MISTVKRYQVDALQMQEKRIVNKKINGLAFVNTFSYIFWDYLTFISVNVFILYKGVHKVYAEYIEEYCGIFFFQKKKLQAQRGGSNNNNNNNNIIISEKL